MANSKDNNDDGSVTINLHGSQSPEDDKNSQTPSDINEPSSSVNNSNIEQPLPIVVQNLKPGENSEAELPISLPSASSPGINSDLQNEVAKLKELETKYEDSLLQDGPPTTQVPSEQPASVPPQSNIDNAAFSETVAVNSTVEQSNQNPISPIPKQDQVYTYTDPDQAASIDPPKEKRSLNKRLIFVIGGLITIVIIVAMFSILKPSSSIKLSPQSVTNSSINYSIHFIKPSRGIKIGSIDSLEAYDPLSKTTIIATVYPVNTTSPCSRIKNIIVLYNININGKRYPVCANDQASIELSDFNHGTKWHEVLIYSSVSSQSININTSKAIIGSVKVL